MQLRICQYSFITGVPAATTENLSSKVTALGIVAEFLFKRPEGVNG